MQLLIPYAEAALLDRLRRDANILELEYRDEGIHVLAVVRPELRAQVAPFEVTRDA